MVNSINSGKSVSTLTGVQNKTTLKVKTTEGGINQANLEQKRADILEDNLKINSQIENCEKQIEAKRKELEQATKTAKELREAGKNKKDPELKAKLIKIRDLKDNIATLEGQKQQWEQLGQETKSIDITQQIMQTENLKADLNGHTIKFQKGGLKVLNNSTINNISIDFKNKQTQEKKNILGKLTVTSGYVTDIEYKNQNGETKTIKALVDFNEDGTFKEMHHYRE